MAETAPGAIVSDKELKALSRIIKDLNALDDASRARVVAYLIARYGEAKK